MKPTLSILIPTYNRARETARALQSILSQADPDIASKIEILVSDNASSGETDLAMAPFRSRIKYFKQPVNIGAERNFAFLLDNSTGIYRWIFGSDDVLLKGALAPIVSILEKHPGLGLLHLKAIGSLEPSLQESAMIGPLRIESGSARIIEDASYRIAFITSNIFNSDLLPDEYSTTDGIGSCLMQIYPYLYAAQAAPVNAVLGGRLICAQALNYSGGYQQLQVFGPNLWKIFDYFTSIGFPAKLLSRVGSRMCVEYYPSYIVCRKTGRTSTLLPDRNAFGGLYSLYKGNPWFWLACVPAFLFGKPALAYTRCLTRFYRAYRYFCLSLVRLLSMQ
jgi:abequosyltransferase